MFFYSYAVTNPIALSYTSGDGPGWTLALIGFLGAAALIIVTSAQRKRTRTKPRLRLVTAVEELQSAA